MFDAHCIKVSYFLSLKMTSKTFFSVLRFSLQSESLADFQTQFAVAVVDFGNRLAAVVAAAVAKCR